MLPGTFPTECLKYFRNGAWPSSRDPVNCRALSANSYKMDGWMGFKFVSVPIKHIREIEYSEYCGHVTDDVT